MIIWSELDTVGADFVSGNIKIGTNLFGADGALVGGTTCTGTLSDNGDGTIMDMTTGLFCSADGTSMGLNTLFLISCC